MSEPHDVQTLSNTDIHVYEAVASHVVESGGAGLADVVRAAGMREEDVRGSLSRLVAQGYVVPKGHEGYALGPHTFEGPLA
ncbi:hypothetical protein SAMN05444920_105612 [Nonomuraea solani]|uniref:IclR helix-turn-helix domain-containing protein n=1 Tax=Nonomuraea solani TaxID=1144553 RepID=A0A1H6DKR0_9ACTN|nr:hypothetical protein [Nonomuraea solani]SEG85940.1 hypothetical protein SAMN05444920_105612 [Nonomuraea solani]